jgi:hypothetical protein
MMSVSIRPTTSKIMAIPTPIRDLLKIDSALIIPLELFAFLFTF